MAMRFDHVHVRTPNVRETAQWYVEKLGARITGEVQQDGSLYTLRLDIGGTRLNVTRPFPGENLPPGSSARKLGLEHFGLATDDLAGLLRELGQKGVKVLEPMHLGPSSENQIAFIEAPDNVRIELMEYSR